MATVTLRSAVNRALTSTEIDNNFINLDTGKVEAGTPVFTGLVTLPSQDIDMTDSSLPDIAPSLNLDFANGEQLDSRVTFGRGSAGTYYDGKSVAKAEENLFTQSNFQGGWNLNAATYSVSGSIAAPDTTLSAATLTSTNSAVGSLTIIYRTSSSIGFTGIGTFSVYAKKGTSNFLGMSNSTTGSYAWANFNLATGVVASSGGCTASIVDAGAGWYRCIMANITIPQNYITYAGIDADPANNTNVFGVFTSGNTIYLWGAQAENRASVTAYTPTTTAPITNYIPVLLSAPLNTPRFDHDSRPAFYGTCTVSGSAVTLPTTFADGSSPSTVNKFYSGSITISGTSYPITNYVGSTRVVTVTGSPTAGVFSLVNKNYGQSLGLLIEEQRTNLVTYSSDFSNGIWGKVNSTITTTSNIAPDGTQTTQSLIESVTNSRHFVYQLKSIIATSIYSASVYIKAGVRRYATLGLKNNVPSLLYAINIDLLTGVITNTTSGGSPTGISSAVVPVGNGWYRCTISMTSITGDTAFYSAIGISNSPSPSWSDECASYQGDGYSGIYIWGAQLEAGSFATSYIPTPSNATVTRFADSASMTGVNFSSWYNQSEGSTFFEWNSYGSSDPTMGIKFDSGSDVNRIQIGATTKTGLALRTYITTNNITQLSLIFGTTAINLFSKSALSWSSSSCIAYWNATTNSYIGTISLPIVNRLMIGCDFAPGVTGQINGHIRKLTYYPKALTSTQLKGLTKP